MRGLSGPTEGKLVSLERTIEVGRTLENDLSIDDHGISRRHARIKVRDQGCSVVDLDSTNGTYVNNRRIREALLEDGDILAFDKIKFSFRAVQVQDCFRQQPRPIEKQERLFEDHSGLVLRLVIFGLIVLVLLLGGLICWMVCFA